MASERQRHCERSEATSLHLRMTCGGDCFAEFTLGLAEGETRRLAMTVAERGGRLSAAMRRFANLTLYAVATYAALAVTAADAQTRQQIAWCEDGGVTEDLRIESCTAVIRSGRFSGKNLALAF